MTTLATLDATVTPIASTDATLDAEIFATVAGSTRQLDADLTIIDVSAAITGGAEKIFFRVSIPGMPGGDLTLEQGELISWSYDMTDSDKAEWSLALPVDLGDELGPLRTPRDWGAPPPGKLAVSFSVTYVLPNGDEFTVPLLADGIATAAEQVLRRPAVGETVHEMLIEGLDGLGRYDRKRVSLELDPYHGETHGQLIARLFQGAGFPSGRLAIDALGTALNSAVEISGEELPGPLRELAQAANASILMDALGDVISMPLVPNVNVPPIWVVTEESFSDEIRLTSTGEVPTCIKITGRAPELTDAASAVGVVLKIEREEVWKDYAVPGAHFQQDVDGTLLGLPQPGSLPEAYVRFSATESIQAVQGGCPLYDETVTYGWRAPEGYRYTLDANGDIDTYSGFWLYEAGAAKDDATASYAWPRHRFVEISRERTSYIRDTAGRTVSKPRRVARWMIVEEALQERSDPLTTWENSGFLSGVKITGGGKGTALDSELYFRGPQPPEELGGTITADPSSRDASHWAESDEKDIRLTTDNYQTGDTVVRTRWSKPSQGGNFRFADGKESPWDRDSNYIAETVDTAYIEAGESNHKIIKRTTTGEGDPVTVVSTGDGYLPEAETWRSDLADRASSRLIEGEFCGLFSNHVAHDAPVEEMPFVETAEAAESIARRKMTELSAEEIAGAWSLNALVQRLQPAVIDMPRMRVQGRGWIQAVSHGQEAGEPPKTEVVIKIQEIA